MTAARVWAVFSAFHPDQTLVDAVRAVVPHTAGVVVVDDGGGTDDTEPWPVLRSAGAHVLRLDGNKGIAAALNRGIRHAFEHGADAVVTFDQDSVPPADFFPILERTLAGAGRAGTPGPIVPEFFADVRQVKGRNRDGTLRGDRVIQSGMLLSAELFARTGGLREDFFIDLVDTEYELRCLRLGLPVIVAEGARLPHALGHRFERRMFGRRVGIPGLVPDIVTLSTPFRYYYRVRNRVVLNRMFLRAFPARMLRDGLFDALHFLNALALARPRRTVWRLYRVAMRDARSGRMGRIPDELLQEAATVRWAAVPVS